MSSLTFLSRSIAVMALLLLSACAAKGPTFQGLTAVQPGESQIVFYRAGGFFGSAVPYSVFEGDLKLARLPLGSYQVVAVAPGQHTFTSRTETDSSVTINAIAGETHFVRMDVKLGALLNRPTLRVVTRDVALQDLQHCRATD